MQVGKQTAGAKYSILYRCINCLDCEYPEDKPLISLYNSSSYLNEEVKHMIRMLEKKKLSLNEICK